MNAMDLYHLKYFKPDMIKNHYFGKRELDPIEERLIHMIDDFADHLKVGEYLKVIKAYDCENYEPHTVHPKGQAVHIYVPDFDILELFSKALTFRANITHGPNFFTGVGLYYKCLGKYKDSENLTGLHLDIRPVFSYRSIDIWGCVPDDDDDCYIYSDYDINTWNNFHKRDGKIYIPINYNIFNILIRDQDYGS